MYVVVTHDPGERFSVVILIRWNIFGLRVTPSLSTISLQNVTHATAVQLSCHVLNFTVITFIIKKIRLQQNEISIKLALTWINCSPWMGQRSMSPYGAIMLQLDMVPAVAPHGDIELGWHGFCWFLLIWWHQTVTWTNVHLSSGRSHDIHFRSSFYTLSELRCGESQHCPFLQTLL